MVKLVVLPKVLKEMKKSPFINIENENSKKTRHEPYIPPGFVHYYFIAKARADLDMKIDVWQEH